MKNQKFVNGIVLRGDVIIPIIYSGSWGCFEDGYIEMGRKDGKGTLLGYDGKPLNGFSWLYDDVRRCID